MQSGSYTFPEKVEVAAFDEFTEVAQLLAEHPFVHFDEIERIKSAKRIPEKGIRLIKPDKLDKLGATAYRIVVNVDGISLIANTNEAMINAVLTLMQLAYLQENGQVLPAFTLEDAPRFQYRGLHLDVSRHFFPISFLKKYIDLMALYKLNVFHWHLTDGPGWRLEIKKYPLLTEKAAWRDQIEWKDWRAGPRRYLNEGDPNASGGFYTQEEAKELVAYAAKRGITIIPEIEMPGHSKEVLAVYPQLSCSGIPYKNSDFCLGNEETFQFLTDVLTEVIAVFPSQYIHIGGDEANKTAWKKCPKCQQRMKDESLKDVDELQSYAVNRIGKFLKSKGKKLLGWDEIIEGGLAPEATVMSWRGEAGGAKAANEGHDVVMAPQSFMYFNSYQGNPLFEPEANGGLLPIQKVYDYDPIAKDIKNDKRKHVLGVQGNVWTEYIPTTEHVEYMAFPRALALSEMAWSQPETKNWTDFENRLQAHYRLLQRLHVNYYRPSLHVNIDIKYDKVKVSNLVTLGAEQYHPVIRYTIDGKNPDISSPIYTEPLELFKSTLVKAALYRDSIRVGPVDSLQTNIHKAIGKKVLYNNPWDTYAAQGDSSLVDGEVGGIDYGDGQWQGFTKDLDVVIDFERREELQSVSLRFIQLKRKGVFIPGSVSVLISDDGKHYKKIQTIDNDVSKERSRLTFKTFDFDLKGKVGRYVRVIAPNTQAGFIFTDEIVIY